MDWLSIFLGQGLVDSMYAASMYVEGAIYGDDGRAHPLTGGHLDKRCCHLFMPASVEPEKMELCLGRKV